MKATIWRTYFLRFCCNKDKKNSDLRLGAIPPLREPHTQSSARRANIIFFFFSSFHWFFCYSRDGLRGKEETIRSVQRVVNSLTFHRRQPKPTTSRAWKIAELPSDSGHNFNEMCPVQTLKNRLVWDGNTLCALKIEILFVQYYSWNLISTKETVEKIF